ncbi:MAG TPA: hypothetical protein VF519_12495 [Mycobacteriales bacterium]
MKEAKPVPGEPAATDELNAEGRRRLMPGPLMPILGTVAGVVGLLDLNPPIAIGVSVAVSVGWVRVFAHLREGRPIRLSARLRVALLLFAVLLVGFFLGFIGRGLIARYTDLPLPPSIRIGNGYAQVGSRGSNTFLDPHSASGLGPRIEPGQVVRIECKHYDPTIASVNPDGYWYRIADSPWNGRYYAPANTFWNGDVPGRLPYTHNTDFSIDDC